MEVTISKQVDEVIKIETPKYFKSKFTNKLVKLNESGMTKVSDGMIYHSEYNPESKYFQDEILELITDYSEISKLEFEERFFNVLVKLQVKAYE